MRPAPAQSLDLEATGMLGRPAVAAWLAELASSLAQGNEIDIEFDGTIFTIDTPTELELHVEVRADPTRTRLGIEIAW